MKIELDPAIRLYIVLVPSAIVRVFLNVTPFQALPQQASPCEARQTANVCHHRRSETKVPASLFV